MRFAVAVNSSDELLESACSQILGLSGESESCCSCSFGGNLHRVQGLGELPGPESCNTGVILQ